MFLRFGCMTDIFLLYLFVVRFAPGTMIMAGLLVATSLVFFCDGLMWDSASDSTSIILGVRSFALYLFVVSLAPWAP